MEEVGERNLPERKVGVKAMIHLPEIREDVCSGCSLQSWGFDFYYNYPEAKVFFCLRCLVRRLWDCLITAQTIKSLKDQNRNLI